MGNVFNLSAIAFHLCLLIPTFAQATPIDNDLALTRALEYVAARESEYIQDLKTLVSFPSISASPDRLPDLQQTARWLEKRLTDAGLHDVKILPNPEGPRPAVYAEYNFQQGPDSSSPTVLVYGHFDVQPVAPESAWTSPPFSPEIRNGALFGRGASDDKGGLLAPIQAIEALIRANATFPLNVKLLLEGEEEIGSPCLEPFLKKYKNQLACDLVLSADGGQINASTPGIALSLRGAVAVEAEVTALPRDAHSGMVGGAVQNSARAIAHIVASLHDPDTNAVRIDGFYDRVRPITEQDRADMATLGFNEKEDLLGGVPVGEQGFTSLERIWHRPTLEVVGIAGGYAGAGIKTVIPSTSIVKLAARLVPDQKPGDIAALIEKHVLKHAPPGCNVTVRPLGFRAAPFVAKRDAPANAAAAKVLKDLMGVEPLFYRGGATIPALAAFQEHLGAETTVFGFALPTDAVHAPDERYELKQYAMGREAYVKLLLELGNAAARGELGVHKGRDLNGGEHTEL